MSPVSARRTQLERAGHRLRAAETAAELLSAESDSESEYTAGARPGRAESMQFKTHFKRELSLSCLTGIMMIGIEGIEEALDVIRDKNN